MAGSALFMAPEQLLHFKTVGPSADVYGAAATLYCLLTTLSPLKLPVPEERASMQMACVATLDSTRVNVRALRPDLPPALADLIDRLVARDPAFRVSTPAATVGEALRRMSLA
jgi:serine/threonine protein kinase